MFTGCGTALVTPFKQDRSLDEAALRMLVRRQVDAGIDFLCPCGTTGESPTLKRHEQAQVVAITVEEARGRVPVLAGAGGYDTSEVIERIAEFKAIGASGILSVTPYYNKPPARGIVEHFSRFLSDQEVQTLTSTLERIDAAARRDSVRHPHKSPSASIGPDC